MIKFFISSALLLSILCANAQGSRLSVQAGDFISLQKINNGVEIKGNNVQLQLSVYAPSIIRVRAVNDSFANDFSYAVVQAPEGNFSSINETNNEIVLQTDSLKVVVDKHPLRIEFYNKENKWLNGDDKNIGISWLGNSVTAYQHLFPDERFIGLGEKTGNLDRRGSSYVNWNEDNYGYNTNQDPLYSTMPFFIGIHDHSTFGLFFDNTYKSYFNFGGSTDDKMYSFGADDGEMNYYFIYEKTVTKIITDYTSLTGRIPMPPLWSLGYQQSRYSYMSQDELLNVAKKLREEKIPADVVYCDIDYMDDYKVFTWNPKTYSNPKSLTDELKKMDFHLVTIIDPGIKIENGYKAYDEGVSNNFFARYPNGEFYTGSVWAGRSHFPDFTKAAARKWWGENFSVLTNNGVTGFWNDMNEPSVWGQNIPDLIQFGQRDTTATLAKVRNIYGMQMARSTYEGTRKLMNGQRPFVLSRAGYSGIQRYSAMWTGDNNPTDEHMLLGYRLINSMGISGEPYVGMDIGGFSGDPSPQLMVRWMSLGTFTPMFRNHTAKNNLAHEPWMWGEDNLNMMRNSISLRYELLPYIYSAFYEAHSLGTPVNRTLAIGYTFDDKVYNTDFQNEFLFGKNILVAPATSTQQMLNVYLPKGNWYRLFSDQTYAGQNSFYVNAALDSLPVFVKAGAIIPMQNVVQSTADNGDGILKLNIWYGDSASNFVYYEDDGNSYEYEKGNYYKRNILFNPSAKQIVLEKPEDAYPTKYSTIQLVLHGFPKLNLLKINDQSSGLKYGGKEIQTISFDNSGNEIKINY